MLDVPNLSGGWTNVALGDVAINSTVATLNPEQDGFERYIIGKHIPEDGNKITTWNEVGDGEFGSRIRTKIKKGDVVCTTRGPKLRVAIATFDCLSAHTNFILRTKDEKVLLQEYLQALVQSEAFQEHLRQYFRGSTNLFVNWSDAAKFEFRLPAVQEQARQLEAISQADNLRTSLDGAIAAIDRLREAIFANEILRISGERTPISGLAKFTSGKSIKASQLPKERSDQASVPVVGGNGVAGYTEHPLRGVPVPCITVGRVGAYCGAVHYFEEPCWVSDNALYVKEHSKALHPRFLELCLRALHLNKHATGGAQPLMTQGIIKRLKIPVPALSAQNEIVSNDDRVAEGRAGLLSRKSDADNLRRFILSNCYPT